MINTETTRAKKTDKWKTDRRFHFADKAFPNLALFFALVIVALLIGLIIVLTTDAWPSIKTFGLSFLTSSVWNPVKEIFGALPAIYGTLLTSAIALVIAIPVSFGAAVFLVEIAPSWLSKPASFLIEMLAAIPSVIIGLWGLFVLVPALRPLERWLTDHVGFLPIFHGTVLGGLSIFSAGIILTFMVIPIITAVSRDAVKAVPNTQREAMLALGATRWEMIRKAVLPYCRSGLVGGVILGLGRALGETMAVTMVIGNADKLTSFLFSPGTTIASKIASNFSEASNGVFVSSLIELALILFGITLLVNVIARLLLWRITSVKTIVE
ncbi:MAG TPA: phosphate ABC transporter permease subunit PstC [Dehalococcoidales bacterium]|nr:phosphate ABC transporter permease subunit PstC [Dehalococcoidales bacterium]